VVLVVVLVLVAVVVVVVGGGGGGGRGGGGDGGDGDGGGGGDGGGDSKWWSKGHPRCLTDKLQMMGNDTKSKALGLQTDDVLHRCDDDAPNISTKSSGREELATSM
jgi:hypothetical protein